MAISKVKKQIWVTFHTAVAFFLFKWNIRRTNNVETRNALFPPIKTIALKIPVQVP